MPVMGIGGLPLAAGIVGPFLGLGGLALRPRRLLVGLSLVLLGLHMPMASLITVPARNLPPLLALAIAGVVAGTLP